MTRTCHCCNGSVLQMDGTVLITTSRTRKARVGGTEPMVPASCSWLLQQQRTFGERLSMIIYWLRTMPRLFLFASIAQRDFLSCMATTTFSLLKSKKQLDQVGIVIRLGHKHWIKTGIKMVDGIPCLSCVVKNWFSDWSTQTFPSASVCIRVHCLVAQNGGSFVIKAAPLIAAVLNKTTLLNNWINCHGCW
jgi:hypothetical protein